MSTRPVGQRRQLLEQPARERPQRPVEDVERRRPARVALAHDDARPRDRGPELAAPSRRSARPRTWSARRCCGTTGRRRAGARGTRPRGGRDVGGRDVHEALEPAARLRLEREVEHARVPSTLIARASSQRQVERDRGRAVQHRVRSRSATSSRPVAEAEPRLRELAARRRCTRSRYGDGSSHSLASTSSSRRSARRVVVGAHQREHLAVARLEQAREHLHAEEAGGAGQEDGRLHATASSRSGTGAVPMAWKPPSTCRISPVIARAWSRQQEAARRPRPAPGPRCPSRAAPGAPTRAASSSKPGMPRAAIVPSGPARHQVHAHAARPEVAREVARDGLERRPWRRPSSRRSARRPARRSPSRRSRRRPPDQRQQRRGQRLQRVRARLERAASRSRAACRGTCRRARPRARRRSRAGRRRRGPSARAGRRRRPRAARAR